MHKEQYSIAIIGPKDVVAGFKALGVEAFNATDGEEAAAHLKEIKAAISDSGGGPAVVMIMEELVREIPADEYKKLAQGALPAIVALPGISGSTGLGGEKLKMLAEQAVGASIL